MTERICANCKQPFVPNRKLGPKRIATVKFCGAACHHESLRKTQEYEVRGDVTAFIFRRKDGTVLEGLIDTADLPKALSVGKTWFPWWGGWRFYVACAGRIMLHRFLTDAPTGLVVDHINHSGLDNRRVKLRVVPQAINSINRAGVPTNNKTGLRGVRWHPRTKKWKGVVKVNGKEKHLGYFHDKEKAAEAVKKFVAERISAATT